MSRLLLDIRAAGMSANGGAVRPNVAGKETQKLFTRSEHMVPGANCKGAPGSVLDMNHRSEYYQPYHPITGEPRWGECVTVYEREEK